MTLTVQAALTSAGVFRHDAVMLDALFDTAATTHGVTVRVSVTFLPDQSSAAGRRWFWSYHIRIENDADEAIQLLTRRWEISDARGQVNIVEGDGVVGEQPLLLPGQSFDYVSGCPLRTPTGQMVGHYGCVTADGRAVQIRIPEFRLAAPAAMS